MHKLKTSKRSAAPQEYKHRKQLRVNDTCKTLNHKYARKVIGKAFFLCPQLLTWHCGFCPPGKGNGV